MVKKWEMKRNNDSKDDKKTHNVKHKYGRILMECKKYRETKVIITSLYIRDSYLKHTCEREKWKLKLKSETRIVLHLDNVGYSLRGAILNESS